MDSREFSDLKLDRKECKKCGAVWINGQHTWATGAIGNEDDLAGLICNKLGDDSCINPRRGSDSGDTWAKRDSDTEKKLYSKRIELEQQRDRFRAEFGEDPHFDD